MVGNVRLLLLDYNSSLLYIAVYDATVASLNWAAIDMKFVFKHSRQLFLLFGYDSAVYFFDFPFI